MSIWSSIVKDHLHNESFREDDDDASKDYSLKKGKEKSESYLSESHHFLS